MKAEYIAYIKIKGGYERYGSQVFATRREALCDAVKLINEARKNPDCQWKNDIETYGSCTPY